MRVTLTFIKESCRYQGTSSYKEASRCNVCNEETHTFYDFESTDPDYRRSFHICHTCFRSL